ncbi:MAG: hypothetical protein NDI62_00340 [Burkholderiales bacterium]|nr:hypothetical protein [Burkholderiales bacterium]
MDSLNEINVLEVKRTFVISNLVRKQRIDGPFSSFLNFLFRKGFLKQISLEDFHKKLVEIKRKVLLMQEKELDKIIKKEWKKRLIAYDNSDWYLMEVDPKEVGVWRRAGELPLLWTNGSLLETAEKFKEAMMDGLKDFGDVRSKYTILNMLKTNVSELQDEKYLFPIMFLGGTGTRGRKRLKKQTKYDIDDGCMRSIALTINGTKYIKAYVGFPKNNI